jgi:magnesium-transporting ATPase (P-type)
LKAASLCTDCIVGEGDVRNEKPSIGDPTEIAIINLALDKGFSNEA